MLRITMPNCPYLSYYQYGIDTYCRIESKNNGIYCRNGNFIKCKDYLKKIKEEINKNDKRN